jgi:hypothetical protein
MKVEGKFQMARSNINAIHAVQSIDNLVERLKNLKTKSDKATVIKYLDYKMANFVTTTPQADAVYSHIKNLLLMEE